MCRDTPFKLSSLFIYTTPVCKPSHHTVQGSCPTGTHTGFALLPQLAHLLRPPPLVCVNLPTHPRSGTLGLHLSNTGTDYSCCIRHNVSVIYVCVASLISLPIIYDYNYLYARCTIVVHYVLCTVNYACLLK